MDGKDYYQILGVERGAGTSEIRRQYFAMAKQYHPDKDGGDTQMMTRLNGAYEVLASPQSRYLYAAELKRAEQTTATPSSVTEPETQVAYYYDEAPRAYNAAEKRAARKAQRQARASRPEKRSWAGRVMSFATAVAMIVIVGAVIAGHLPTQGVTSALDLTPSQSDSSAADSSGGAASFSNTPNTGSTSSTIAGDPTVEDTVPDPTADTAPTDTDGTLDPTTPAETHYRCTLHYIASYKRMNCN
jgi:curved DNA-binding protein CbpA